jgi:hypothetical protein
MWKKVPFEESNSLQLYAHKLKADWMLCRAASIEFQKHLFTHSASVYEIYMNSSEFTSSSRFTQIHSFISFCRNHLKRKECVYFMSLVKRTSYRARDDTQL